MAEQFAEELKVQRNQDAWLHPLGFSDNYAEVPAYDTSPFQKLDLADAEFAAIKSAHVQLKFENLACFEAVDRQFERWGVTFSNVIALQPSNPAYAPRSGTTVLMGAPKSGWLEATFHCPVRYVSGNVTSSRRAVLTAFDTDNQPLTQTESPGANLAGADAETPPNLQLSLSAENIRRVTIYAFDGQLTLDEFSFTYQ
jgi:hypothetical protein